MPSTRNGPECAGAVRGDLAPPLGEAPYWSATATLPTRLGELSVEFPLEAAFEGTQPVVFDRIRVRGHLTRAGTYTLAHPYGQTRIVAESPAEQRNVDVTLDSPCSLTGGCAGRITNWLRSTTPTVGYLSGTLVFMTVTGGTVRNSLALVRNGRFSAPPTVSACSGRSRRAQPARCPPPR